MKYVLLFLVLSSCASNPNKATHIDTEIDSKGQISGDTLLGIKDGYMIVQKKVLINEELRRLQNDVYELEDHVYGNRKYGSMGLYGVLRECRFNVSAATDGKIMWTEEINRLTDKEENFTIGLDDKDKLVGISEEFLLDRMSRFKSYKSVLEKRQDDFDEKISICKLQLVSK